MTVYVVVEVGFAVTELPVVELNPVEGDQLYVLAPPAVNVVEPPIQIDVLPALTVTDGSGFTVTVMFAVF